jgi:hypothetical protein
LAGGITVRRRREKTALPEQTAEILENFKVPGFLDSLGADFQLSLAAKGKNEVDHIVTRAIREHVCDQGPLDLDKVHGEAPQVCQRSGAASKIVDGGRDVQTFELREKG